MADKERLKTLATCTPTEFLKQTARIVGAAERFLNVTEIMSIREREPEGIEAVTPDMPDEEIKELFKRNVRRKKEQALKNAKDMLLAACVKDPDATVSLLALCCFVEPEDADKHPMSMYMDAVTELLACESVADFFTSFIGLGERLTRK